MTQGRLLGAAAVVLVLAAGCSSTPSSPTSSPAASTEPAPSPSVTSAAPAACPDGSYLVTALEGRGSASAVGKGSGGDITADFTAGTFTLASDGASPVKVDLGPTNADLRFTGQIVGTYAGDPGALRLTTTQADGQVSVKGFGVSRTFSAGDLAAQLVGQGATAQVTCDEAAGTAVVVLPNAALTLTRAGR